MTLSNSLGRKIFIGMNLFFLFSTAAVCIFPMVHVLALSFSSNTAVEAGIVGIIPVNFTTKAYEFIVRDFKFVRAFIVSISREVLGISINMALTVLVAYPLSKNKRTFLFRDFYVWFFLITILFNGGLIPTYMVVKETGLINSIWSLVLPGAVPVFNAILLQNFFKELPNEIEESAFIDGAGHWINLVRIILPLSKPALATLVLFVAVTHWNSWFDGLIYMNSPEKYPLQSYLQTVIVQKDLTLTQLRDVSDIQEVCERNSRAAQIFLAMLPIIIVYPFLQKHFTTGIVMGSVKG